MTARPVNETRRWLMALLALQVGLGLFLFGADLARVLPRMLNGSDAPGLTTPTAPGDQTRRYDPARMPAREAPPGARPMPGGGGDMPSRLIARRVTWEGAEVLTLTGAIGPGDAARLIAEEVLEEGLTVYLNSPGGSVSDALALGRWLRERGANTAMGESDICLSACPYVLAGGVERTVEEGAWVGVHQHYFDQNTVLPAFLAVEDIQRGQGEVMAHLIEMGLDPALMQPALLTPPSEIYILTPQELADYRVVTDLPE